MTSEKPMKNASCSATKVTLPPLHSGRVASAPKESRSVSAGCTKCCVGPGTNSARRFHAKKRGIDSAARSSRNCSSTSALMQT